MLSAPWKDPGHPFKVENKSVERFLGGRIDGSKFGETADLTDQMMKSKHQAKDFLDGSV